MVEALGGSGRSLAANVVPCMLLRVSIHSISISVICSRISSKKTYMLIRRELGKSTVAAHALQLLVRREVHLGLRLGLRWRLLWYLSCPGLCKPIRSSSGGGTGIGFLRYDALMLVSLDDIRSIISQSFGLGECVDQRLCFNSAEALGKALVKEAVTGLADDEISNLVEVGSREVADQFALGFADHLFTKIPHRSTRN